MYTQMYSSLKERLFKKVSDKSSPRGWEGYKGICVKPQLCHFCTVWPWSYHLTPQLLSFLLDNLPTTHSIPSRVLLSIRSHPCGGDIFFTFSGKVFASWLLLEIRPEKSIIPCLFFYGQISLFLANRFFTLNKDSGGDRWEQHNKKGQELCCKSKKTSFTML